MSAGMAIHPRLLHSVEWAERMVGIYEKVIKVKADVAAVLV